MFETRKVFDCWKMPESLRKAFFESQAEFNRGNGVYVNWIVGDTDMPEFIPIDEWLLANGAEKNEAVLISHHW